MILRTKADLFRNNLTALRSISAAGRQNSPFVCHGILLFFHCKDYALVRLQLHPESVFIIFRGYQIAFFCLNSHKRSLFQKLTAHQQRLIQIIDEHYINSMFVFPYNRQQTIAGIDPNTAGCIIAQSLL